MLFAEVIPEHDTVDEILVGAALRAGSGAADRAWPGRAARASLVVAAPPGLAATMVHAVLDSLDVSSPVRWANDLEAARALLPADVLLVDVALAADEAEALGRLRARRPGMLVAGLAERADAAAVAGLRAAGLWEMLFATDGWAALRLRIGALLERVGSGDRLPVRVTCRAGAVGAPAGEMAPGAPAGAMAPGAPAGAGAVLRELATARGASSPRVTDTN